MTFTPYTLITTILSAAVVIVVLNVYLRQVNYETLFSPTALAVILLIPLLRLFIPVEFPFTKVIRFYEVLPVVSKVMTQPVVLVAPGYGINLTHVLLLVWLAGFAYSEGKSVVGYRRFLTFSYSMESEEDERDRRVMAEYFRERGLKPRKVRLLRLRGVHVPLFFGLKNPTIVLPRAELTERQLRDVLGHELSHCVHGDFVAKKVLCVLCSVYWWLPPVKEFRGWIDSIMEIRADREVMKGKTREERDGYIDMMEYVEAYEDPLPAVPLSGCDVATLLSDSKDIMERRFTAIRSPQNPRRQKCLTVLFIAIISVVMALSFCFVIQPATTGEVLYHDEDITSYVISIPESGDYLVLRDDGEYDLYFDNKYVGKVENPEDEDLLKDIPIINQQEES